MNKKIKIISLIIFAVLILTAFNIAAFFFSSLPASAQAIEIPELEVEIPGLEEGLGAPEVTTVDGKPYITIPWLANYISAIYRFGVAAAVIIAAVMIMFGGFLWLAAAGSPERVSRAKSYIFGSTIGMIIALSSYVVLQTINPPLTELPEVRLPAVQRVCKANAEITVPCRCGEESGAREDGWCCYQETGAGDQPESGNNPYDEVRELKWQEEPCEGAGSTMGNGCILKGEEVSWPTSQICCNGCSQKKDSKFHHGETVFTVTCEEPCKGADKVGQRKNVKGIIYGTTEAQKADATKKNKSLLDELIGNQAIAGYITSISDTRIPDRSNRESTCEFWFSDFDNYRSKDGCIHTKNSLHYGGSLFEKIERGDFEETEVIMDSFSCAFDIVVEDVEAFKILLNKIDPGGKKYNYKVLNEDDHLHVGVNGKEDCGAAY